MSETRKLDTASAVAALLSEGGDRLVVTTEAKYIDVERDHERKGRLKPIKVARADGTVDEIGVRDYLEGVVRARQVIGLQDALPECACCRRKVAPVDTRRIGRNRSLVLCRECPRCTCGAIMPIQTMCPSSIARRGGERPRCLSCAHAAARDGARKWTCRTCDRVVSSVANAPSKMAARGGLSAQCKPCAAKVTAGRVDRGSIVAKSAETKRRRSLEEREETRRRQAAARSVEARREASRRAQASRDPAARSLATSRGWATRRTKADA